MARPGCVARADEGERSFGDRLEAEIFSECRPVWGRCTPCFRRRGTSKRKAAEVVVGIVETHGRKETEALVEGMPIMPRLQIEYRGTMLTEMDLDAILTWHP